MTYLKTWFRAAPELDPQDRPAVGSLVNNVPYGAMQPAYPDNWQPTPLLSERGRAWNDQQCEARQPKYDWQLTVRFARNNGVKL